MDEQESVLGRSIFDFDVEEHQSALEVKSAGIVTEVRKRKRRWWTCLFFVGLPENAEERSMSTFLWARRREWSSYSGIEPDVSSWTEAVSCLFLSGSVQAYCAAEMTPTVFCLIDVESESETVNSQSVCLSFHSDESFPLSNLSSMVSCEYSKRSEIPKMLGRSGKFRHCLERGRKRLDTFSRKERSLGAMSVIINEHAESVCQQRTSC